MKKLYLSAVLMVLLCTAAFSQATNPVAQTVPYSQDFSAVVHTSTAYPAGWQGWTITTSPGATFNAAAPTADRLLIASSGASTNSGNVHNYNGKLGFLNTGSLDLSMVLSVNTTGKTSVPVSYDIMTIRNPYDGTSNSRINEVTLQYRVGETGPFTTLAGIEYQNNTTLQTGAGVTTPQNLVNKSITLPAACDNQAIVQIRWASRQVSGGGSRPSFAIDNVTVGSAGPDITAPSINIYAPVNAATDVNTDLNLQATFNESIQKTAAPGNIVIKNFSDNSVVETIPVSSAAVAVSGNILTVDISPLSKGTHYYVEIAPASLEDLAGNDFPGISGSATWHFTTTTALIAANFNSCSTSLSDGFTQYSTTGAITWACTSFGYAGTSTGSAPNGVQMNGFDNGLNSNVPNVDWLISPSIDLTATAFPLLSFYSRTRFNGLPLELKVSTDYVSGDPSLSTWTTINGKFPAQTTDVWTLSSNINLSAFKAANVRIAFVYTSSDDEGARWTLDEFRIENSATPPPASLTISTTDMQYGFITSGSTSTKTFNFTGNDLTSDVSVSAPGGFSISKDGVSFSSALTYTLAEANNISKTVYVRFEPTEADKNFSGGVTVSSSSITSIINLKGTTIDVVKTLEVVNWNVEWFGSPGNGPTNEAQQLSNVTTILQNIGADIYALAEIVDEAKLASVVAAMPGYAFVISNYGSHTNPNETSPSPLSEAQKLAFVYKTSVFTNVTTTALLSAGINTPGDISTVSYNNWASGRYPYMLTADVTLDGVTKSIKFILIHAKANTAPTATSYARRQAGAVELHNLLNTTYPNDNIIILGDFNDDLDQSITDGFTTTSYSSFTTDGANYSFPTLSLSLAGKKSTVAYNDVIDHVVVSNDMGAYYMNSTVNILTDVTSLVTNFGSTTSDHYPVFTRFAFSAAILPVSLKDFSVVKQNNTARISWKTLQENNSDKFVIERSTDGRNFTAIGSVKGAGFSSIAKEYSFIDENPVLNYNYYRLKAVDKDGRAAQTNIAKLYFGKDVMISLSPNPAKGFVKINLYNVTESTTVQLVNLNGQLIRQQNASAAGNQFTTINLQGVPSGTYVLKVISSKGTRTEKLIVE